MWYITIPGSPSCLVAATATSSSVRWRIFCCCWISTAVQTELSPWIKKENENERWLLKTKEHKCYCYINHHCEENRILTQAQGELRLWFMLPIQGRLLLCKCWFTWFHGLLNKPHIHIYYWKSKTTIHLEFSTKLLSHGFVNHFPKRTNFLDSRHLKKKDAGMKKKCYKNLK